MHEIVLVESYSKSSLFWPNLLRLNKIPDMSVEDVLHRYQGFEGELVLISQFDENNETLNEVINNFSGLENQQDYLILSVISGFEEMPSPLVEQMMYLGFDVGVCEREKTVYSSIFNEILFGNLPELIAFKDLLNGNFLFPNRSLAEKYVALHNNLSDQGKGVEDYEKMNVYEIWK